MMLMNGHCLLLTKKWVHICNTPKLRLLGVCTSLASVQGVSKSTVAYASSTIHLTQCRILSSLSGLTRHQLQIICVLKDGFIPLNAIWPTVVETLISHLLNSTAQSRLAIECLTLQKNAWLLATRSTPSLTGMPSMCTAYSNAVEMSSLRLTSGHWQSDLAITSGSLDSRLRYGPKCR